eukprot:gene20024-26000_t
MPMSAGLMLLYKALIRTS